MAKQRNVILDALKGIAIIVVVLYHFGGYSTIWIFRG